MNSVTKDENHTYSSHSHCWGATSPTILASASRNFCEIPSPRAKWRKAYLVFEESWWSTRLIWRQRIPENDSFTSAIDNILKKPFQVRCSSTFLPDSYHDVFPSLFASEFVFWWREYGSKFKMTGKEELPNAAYRCPYKPSMLGISNTTYLKLLQSIFCAAVLLANRNASLNVPLPNLTNNNINNYGK